MRLIEVAKDSFAVVVEDPDTGAQIMIGVHSLNDTYQRMFESRANGTHIEANHSDPTKRHK